MSTTIRRGKENFSKFTTTEMKEKVEKEAWVALKQYFDGGGNGPEAKVACVVISTLAREQQANNNARQLTLLERRFLLERPKMEG